MYRKSAFALLVLLGLTAWAQAQPGDWGPTPPAASALQGTWYNEGDPAQPTYIQVLPYERRLVITNAQGDRTPGRVLWYGNRIVAYNWGNLQGQVNGRIIRWANGSTWTR